jgi:2-C-methyl-D-erythritol 4-phosphate cytidylyltransferase/2-C-methyl-D-erythritol 2,4-cyclodiphosphate synthase
VLHPDDLALAPAGVEVATGGATRRASVLSGLEHLARHGTAPRHVLIHDAARPTVPPPVIAGVLDALRAGAPAAAPALAVTDALWTGHEGRVTGTRDRAGLFAAQTPQGFDFAAILCAHRAHDGDAADDVAVARAARIPVTITQGHADNLKITHPGDIDRASRILGGQMDIRTGTGFDVHRFGPGDHCMLCGVAVPHERGLQGHSDADVGLHALADAIYGALAEGDIGHHFPPSDPRWKGAESHVFLRHAVGLAKGKGFEISNMDVTLICERPRIGPHAAAMRAALATITGVAPDRISVKATTTERLGFTGREEGVAAQTVVTLVKSCT